MAGPDPLATFHAALEALLEDLPPLLTIEAARAANSLIEASQTMRLGDAHAAIAAAPHALSGTLAIGGHFTGPGAGYIVRDGDTFRLEPAL